MIPEIRINNVGVGNVGIGVVGDVGVSAVSNVSNVSTMNIQDADVQRIDTNDLRSVNNIQVADTRIWTAAPPNVRQLDPPVVVDIGKPIVNMPGCVEVHKEHAKTRNKNKQLVNNDPKVNVVLCDSGAPNFIPPDYQANRLTWKTFYGEQPEAGGVKTNTPEAPETPETSATPPKTSGETKEEPPCPGPLAPRIGDVAQNQTEKVSGFELQRDPKNPDGVKICVTLYEDIGAVEAFLPSPQIVTTTAVIATVATGSALLAKPLADLLLKVVKPVVKKAIGAIQKKLGKTPYRPTQAELKTNEYRKKKGLLGINFAKEHAKKLKKEKERKKKESQ